MWHEADVSRHRRGALALDAPGLSALGPGRVDAG